MSSQINPGMNDPGCAVQRFMRESCMRKATKTVRFVFRMIKTDSFVSVFLLTVFVYPGINKYS